MSVFKELRRRKVFRFGGIYIVGAWLVFQVADVFFPAWGVPDAALRYLLYAAIACFPIALVFSWFYDVSTDGISRTLPAGASEIVDTGLKRTDYLVLAGLLVVAGAILYESMGRVVESAGESPLVEAIKEKPPNSIAVLPFDNLDPNPDTEYFSDGVSEEILHRLGAIRALKVIGRTSSFPFGGADMELDRISDILGVKFLLNGSIRRAGDQVRLTARLVDDAGYQVWSESFDGDLSNIFAFQDEIAEQVASEITRELVVLESPEPARATHSVEAYSQYLIGKEYFHNRPPNWKDRAAAAYQRAIDEDPDYAPPYAGLAIVVKMGADIEGVEDRWQYVDYLTDKALELDPELPEAWLARGWIHRSEPGYDPERNVEYLEKALELDPNLGIAYNSLYVALAEAGRIEEGFAMRERGLEIDPLNPPLVLNNSDVYLARGDFEGWKRTVSKLLDLPEPPGMVYNAMAGTHRDWGRLAEALHWAKQSSRAHGGSQAWLPIWLSETYEQLGMPEAADYWVTQIERHLAGTPFQKAQRLYLRLVRGELAGSETSIESLEEYLGVEFDGDVHHELLELSAYALIAAGLYEDGIELLEPLVELPEDPREVGTDTVTPIQWLLHAYRQTGRGDKATPIEEWLAEFAADVRNPQRPFYGDPAVRIQSALHYAMEGRLKDAAVAARVAFEAGWRAYHIEKYDPTWRGAWQSKEFAPILADIQADLARQRAEVEAAEAEHDFRAEYEALLAESRN